MLHYEKLAGEYRERHGGEVTDDDESIVEAAFIAGYLTAQEELEAQYEERIDALNTHEAREAGRKCYEVRWRTKLSEEDDVSDVEISFARGFIECRDSLVASLKDEVEAVEKGESKIFYNRRDENRVVIATLKTMANHFHSYWMNRGRS